jgi:hypothetical protein
MNLSGTCQGTSPGPRRVISASRRTDLAARFPEWLAGVLAAGEASVLGPRGRSRVVDLRPEAVHTLALWSKDFAGVLGDRNGLRGLLRRYDQAYFLLTITGLGGTPVERGVPPPASVLEQVGPLVELAGHPRRVSLRFDPVVHWKEPGGVRSNLDFFPTLARRAAALGVVDVRFSFAQWYGKAVRRADRLHFPFVDPEAEAKIEEARGLAAIAAGLKLNLYSCSQDFLTAVPGVLPSACLDGRLLEELHPRRLPASRLKDKSQRAECRCTESVDIGSYAQSCPHACLYCYASAGITDK